METGKFVQFPNFLVAKALYFTNVVNLFSIIIYPVEFFLLYGPNNSRDSKNDLKCPGSRPKTTKLQLFSKAGFNSSWKKIFLPAEEEEFLLTSGEKVKVKMMHMKGYFAYKEDKNLDAKVVKIDYKVRSKMSRLYLSN